jgi:hypothetical protein
MQLHYFCEFVSAAGAPLHKEKLSAAQMEAFCVRNEDVKNSVAFIGLDDNARSDGQT